MGWNNCSACTQCAISAPLNCGSNPMSQIGDTPLQKTDQLQTGRPIETGGGLVQQQNARRHQKLLRNRQPPPLPPTDPLERYATNQIVRGAFEAATIEKATHNAVDESDGGGKQRWLELHPIMGMLLLN